MSAANMATVTIHIYNCCDTSKVVDQDKLTTCYNICVFNESFDM